MSSTDQEIMDATYRVLVEHGYAGLSMRRIAEQFDGSQSLIYYHYDNKEALLAGFLEYLIAEFERELDDLDEVDPRERLRTLVDLVLPSDGDTEHLRFQQTLMEIRTQTPHQDRYRGLFEELDQKVHSEVAATLTRGLEEGVFADVTPSDGADRLVLLMYGVTSRYVPMDDWDGIARGRRAIDEQVEQWIIS